MQLYAREQIPQFRFSLKIFHISGNFPWATTLPLTETSASFSADHLTVVHAQAVEGDYFLFDLIN